MSSGRDFMDRRSFIRLGAVTTGMAVGGVSAAEERPESTSGEGMKYRPLGKTGLKVSEISFGTYGFNNPGLLSAALDAGINFICTSGVSEYGVAEESIGKAIGKRRDKVVILTGVDGKPGTPKEHFLKALDRSLARLKTDHIDVFKIHSVVDPEQLKNQELFAAFEEAKNAGKALHLAVSGHDWGLVDCLNTAVDDGRFEVLQCRYDFVSYKDQQERIFQRAVEKGIGIVVFKVQAGQRQNEIKDLETGGLSFRQATVKWALSHPDVSSVCVAITNFDQIKELCGAVGKKLGQAELEMLQRYASWVYDKYCRNCGTCEASCPHRVAVADIMRYAMYFKYYGREKDSMKLYASLPRERTASACLSCEGSCHGSCPYGRRIRDGLVEAHEMLT